MKRKLCFAAAVLVAVGAATGCSRSASNRFSLSEDDYSSAAVTTAEETTTTHPETTAASEPSRADKVLETLQYLTNKYQKPGEPISEEHAVVLKALLAVIDEEASKACDFDVIMNGTVSLDTDIQSSLYVLQAMAEEAVKKRRNNAYAAAERLISGTSENAADDWALIEVYRSVAFADTSSETSETSETQE